MNDDYYEIIDRPTSRYGGMGFTNPPQAPNLQEWQRQLNSVGLQFVPTGPPVFVRHAPDPYAEARRQYSPSVVEQVTVVIQQPEASVRRLFEIILVDRETEKVAVSHVIARDEGTARIKAFQKAGGSTDTDVDDFDMFVRPIGDIGPKKARSKAVAELPEPKT